MDPGTDDEPTFIQPLPPIYINVLNVGFLLSILDKQYENAFQNKDALGYSRVAETDKDIYDIKIEAVILGIALGLTIVRNQDIFFYYGREKIITGLGN
jgi:hypothetical protein